jgi:hypothetical protein
MAKGKKLSSSELDTLLKESPSERKRIFRELQKHIESGYSLDCFTWMSDNAIMEFLKVYPDEFSERELYDSMRKAKAMWEDIGKRQAFGTCLGNSRSWFYNMSNRYGWSERSKVDQEVKGNVSVSIVNYNSDS